MEKVISILLCEDQEILSDGLSAALNKDKELKVITTVDDAEKIMESLDSSPFDILLSDIITKNKHNVLDYLPEIKNKYPLLKIVLITGFPDVSFMERAKKIGVNSFVYKNVPTKELISLIKNTSQGYSIYPTNEKTNSEILSSLTTTEMKVLRLFCNGKDRTEIADTLSISISSVKNHISAILEKTGFPTLVKLGIYVVKKGLILPD